MRAAAAAAILTASSAAVLADGRAPTAEEKATIETALKGQGFSTWGKIEFDDGKWEIDNAMHSDGKTYDVDLAKADLAVLKKELDAD
ncbi:MAG: PepSY domain-containing protein [Hyphomicrobium sp.]|nr:PepSY domain-containing protein [Hyphomicrobium sp.]